MSAADHGRDPWYVFSPPPNPERKTFWKEPPLPPPRKTGTKANFCDVNI